MEKPPNYAFERSELGFSRARVRSPAIMRRPRA